VPADPRRWAGRKVAALTALVLSTYGTVCHLCGQPGATSADHLVPRSKGGDHSIANMRPSHLGCNIARGDMDLTEWRRRHPPPTRPALPPSKEW
jgi:5-methylcytosine-specific restriction endonuclease McrA